ncbi:MAG: hypothetical protein GY822_27795 [Deltaproteobacteria bacterium]|nr:hypothetical protein [Deltaproteobacteria bacterium]
MSLAGAALHPAFSEEKDPDDDGTAWPDFSKPCRKHESSEAPAKESAMLF